MANSRFFRRLRQPLKLRSRTPQPIIVNWRAWQPATLSTSMADFIFNPLSSRCSGPPHRLITVIEELARDGPVSFKDRFIPQTSFVVRGGYNVVQVARPAIRP